ncbi:S-layer homology domain-containing protein [Paenibacillus sp. GCM10027626]|uniref:S-layer homology domain-containing protein n=1 Tax=Paenibacillus sp. GCM10027626 TaxID=3273411 RepID=UPI0036403527
MAKKWLASVMLSLALLVSPMNGLSSGERTTVHAADALQSVLIGNFESDEEVWQLGLGDQAGAKGEFVRDDVDAQSGQYAGKLSGDFSTGGNYVSLGKTLVPLDVQSLAFSIKSSDIAKILIRIKDSTGQVHQQYVPLTQAGWQQIEITKFDGGDNYTAFGGANDKKWHGPAQRVEFLLEKPRLLGGKVSGSLWLDNVTAMAPPQEPLWEAAVGDFEKASELWDVGYGMEFPGANGDFTRDSTDAKSGNYSGKLSGDFTNGGKYIALSRDIPPIDMQKLSFWVKTADAQWFTLRVKDATGQAHQQRIALSKSTDWQKVEIFKFDGGQNYLSFGGANDQKWHGPAQKFELLLEQSSFYNGKLSGEIRLDHVVATAPFPDLTVQQVQLGNVFLESEPVSFQLATKGDTVRWQVRDHLDHKVLEGSNPVQDGLIDLTIPLQQLGYYTLTIKAEKDSQLVKSTEVSFARLSNADPTLTPSSPFSISTHLAWAKEGWSPELSQLLRRAGAKNFRDEITWEALEYEKGKYRKPANRDIFMRRTHQDGLNPFIILNYTNPFYDQNSTPYTDEGRQGFANYGAALLDLYGNQIQFIEVYNEFNGSFGSRGNGIANSSPESYFKLLKQTYETIKQARPDVTIVGMATAGTPLDWIEGVFKLGGLKYMDAVSIHPYQSQRPPDGMVDAVRNTQNLIRKYNDGQLKPIWYSEIGWPTGGSIGIAENTQASYLVRTHVQALAEGVEKVFWYDLMNDGMQPDYHEHHFGLLRNREDSKGAFAPKPAYPAYAAMTRALIDAKFVEKEAAAADIFSYKFDHNGQDLRVVWAGKMMQAVIETDSPIQISDIMGNSETYTPQNGKVYVTLSGEPHYIAGNIRQLAPSAEFSITGEKVVVGEDIVLSLTMNNPNPNPVSYTLQFEGNTYELYAASGAQVTQKLTVEGANRSGARVLTGFLSNNGAKAGKLQFEVNTLQPYQVKVQPSMDTYNPADKKIRVHIKNLSSLNELTVNGLDWQFGDHSGHVELNTAIQPDSASDIEIPIGEAELEKSYPVKVTVAFDKANPFVYEGKFDFNPIYQRTVTNDGALDPEIENSVPTIHLSQGTIKLTDYKGKDDLDGDIWLHFDQDNFYLTAKIKDDVHAYPATGADIWKNDSIQFALSRGIPGESFEWYEYGVSDTANGPQIYRWNAPSGVARGPVSNGKLSVTRDEDHKITLYKLALPWSELTPIKPVKEEGISFSLLVNDNDGAGRRGWIEWGSGIGVEKKPSLFRSMQWMAPNVVVPLPEAHNASYSTREGVPVEGQLQADHAEGTTLTYEIVDNGTQGTAEITDVGTGAFIYTPNAGAEGQDTFTFRVYDGHAYSNTAAVTITIVRPGEDASLNDLRLNGATVPGFNPNTTKYTVIWDQEDALPEITAEAADEKAIVRIEPAAQVPGIAKIHVTSADGTQRRVYEIEFVLRQVELPLPEAHNASYTTREGVAVEGQLTANHAEGTTLTYEIVANGAKGEAKMTDAGNGRFVYMPHASATGQDTFTFRVHDGHAYSNTATVTMTIEPQPVNPPWNPGIIDPGSNISYTGQLYLPGGAAGEVNLGKDVKFVIPAGATDTGGRIIIEKLSESDALVKAAKQLASPVFELRKEPAGSLKKAAALSVAFDAAKIGKDQYPSLRFYDEEQKKWVEIDSKLDGNTLTAEIDVFGKYAVFAMDRISAEPEPGSGQKEVSLSDIKGHWAQQEIEQAVRLGIVQGYADQSFRPNQSISRQELVAMLARALKPASSNEAAPAFTDQGRIGSWALKDVAAAVQAGWITGYADGSFRPQEGITRTEMAAIIARAAKLPIAESAMTSFSDDEAIASWAKGYINAAAASGLLKGQNKNRFVPNGIVTRSEAAVIAVRLLEQP